MLPHVLPLSTYHELCKLDVLTSKTQIFIWEEFYLVSLLGGKGLFTVNYKDSNKIVTYNVNNPYYR